MEETVNNIENNLERLNILSLDGGGVRGMIEVSVLTKLEEDGIIKSIYDEFDYFSGVSAGAMPVVAFITPSDTDKTKPKYTASQIKELFVTNAKEVFSQTWWWYITSGNGLFYAKYCSSYKKKVLTDLFGDLTLSQLLKPLIVPVYDMITNKSFVVTTDEFPNLRVVDLIMGTTAAPTFFIPHEHEYEGKKYIWADGGVGVNNTSMICLTNILHKYKNVTNMKILNIGTGRHHMDFSTKWLASGLIGLGDDIVDMFMGATTSASITECKKILGDGFLRVSYELEKKYNVIDITTDEYLKYYEKIANDWFTDEHMKELKLWKAK